MLDSTDIVEWSVILILKSLFEFRHLLLRYGEYVTLTGNMWRLNLQTHLYGLWHLCESLVYCLILIDGFFLRFVLFVFLFVCFLFFGLVFCFVLLFFFGFYFSLASSSYLLWELRNRDHSWKLFPSRLSFMTLLMCRYPQLTYNLILWCVIVPLVLKKISS